MYPARATCAIPRGQWRPPYESDGCGIHHDRTHLPRAAVQRVADTRPVPEDVSGDDDDREEDQLQERVEISRTDDPTYRVTFERDEGQEYRIGARVAVHPMNSLFRTIAPDPATGSYLVMRCERVRDVGWKALRVSLHLVNLPGADAAPFSVVADDLG